MSQSKTFIVAAFFLSLAAHSLFFIPMTSNGKREKRFNSLRSPMRVDRIIIKSEAPKKRDQKNKIPKKTPNKLRSNTSKNSIKGSSEALKNQYLAYVRQKIVSLQKYPYLAKKLGLSARYDLVITIFPSGEFDFEMNSAQEHSAFNQSIESLFREIGKFRPLPENPSENLQEGMVIELPLEFVP